MPTSASILHHLNQALTYVGAHRHIDEFNSTLVAAMNRKEWALDKIRMSLELMQSAKTVNDKQAHCRGLIRDFTSFEKGPKEAIDAILYVLTPSYIGEHINDSRQRCEAWSIARRSLNNALNALHDLFVQQKHFKHTFPELYQSVIKKDTAFHVGEGCNTYLAKDPHHKSFSSLRPGIDTPRLDLFSAARLFDRCCEYVSLCDVVAVQDQFVNMASFFNDYVSAFARISRDIIAALGPDTNDWALKGLETLTSDAFENHLAFNDRHFYKYSVSNVFTMLDALHTIMSEI